MTPPFIAAALWLVIANLIAMLPSKRRHWPAAWGLIAIGLPILAWIFWEHGLWLTLPVLAAGAWILRWPVRYLVRWLRARLMPTA